MGCCEASSEKHRWGVILPATATICVTMMGTLFAYNVFTLPLRQARPGWTRAAINIAIAIEAAVTGFVPFFIGADLAKRGLRFYGLLGTCLLSSGMALQGVAMQADVEFIFYVGGAVGGIGYGSVYVATLQNFIMWFHQHKSTAGGVYGFLLGIGAMTFTRVYKILIEWLGVWGALYTLAGGYIVICGPWFFFLRFPPSLNTPAQDRPQTLTRYQVLKTREFWTILGLVSFSLMPGWGLVSAYTVIFQETKQTSEDTANLLTVLIEGVYTLSRLLMGILAQAIGIKRTYILLLAIEAIGFALLPLILTETSFWVFFSLLCFIVMAYGGSKILIAPAVAEYFGPENANTVVGMSLLGISIASAAGPNIVALTHYHLASPTHGPRSFDLFYYASSVICIGGLLCSLCLRNARTLQNTRLENMCSAETLSDERSPLRLSM